MRSGLMRRADPGMALFPLRLFLGGTFVYAGIQKLSDPGFLQPGAPTYIGTQLRGFAHGTPGGFLLRTFAIPHARVAGVATALTEIAVGLLVLVGLLTGLAALVGLVLNLVLFLTNSWNVSPYFLGSDIVFVFAWLPFVLAGAAGQPAVDHVIERLRSSPRLRWTPPEPGDPPLTRRAVVARGLGMVGAATLGIGALSALAKGTYRSHAQQLGRGGPQAPAGPAPSPARSRPPQAAAHRPPGAVRLARSSQLPRDTGGTYRDPADGSAGIVIRGTDGRLVAYSAVCTHAGCTVGYQNGQIVCPCHGGVFDPRTGAVVSGPPPTGLARKRVIETGGEIYAPRS